MSTQDPKDPANDTDTYRDCEYIDYTLQLKQSILSREREENRNFIFPCSHGCPRCDELHRTAFVHTFDFPDGRWICYSCGLIFNLWLCGVSSNTFIQQGNQPIDDYMFHGMEVVKGE